jgi:DNA replication protein DnaC
VNESLPELIPFNQQVHQVLSDARPQIPRIYRFQARIDLDRGSEVRSLPINPGPGVGAQVASLRCPILRPGHREVYLNLPKGDEMNLIELNRALCQLRLGGMAAVLETRLRQAQAENMTPLDLLSCLVSDELTRRAERLLERRRKQAQFRDPLKTLDNFDFDFNKKMNRSLVFELATGTFIARHEDGLFLGPPGSGKSHLAQAIGQAAIQQGYRVLYHETHTLLDELADATLDGTRKEYLDSLVTVPLLILDDLGMRKLPLTAAEELLEIIMRRYERAITLVTSNRLCGALHKRLEVTSVLARS